jgi:hypothetical protein
MTRWIAQPGNQPDKRAPDEEPEELTRKQKIGQRRWFDGDDPFVAMFLTTEAIADERERAGLPIPAESATYSGDDA